MRAWVLLAFLPALSFGQFAPGGVLGRVDDGGLSRDVVYVSDLYNDLADSLFARMNSVASDSFKFAANRLIVKLYNAGIFEKADVYRIYASQDTQSASLNIASSEFKATLMGTVNLQQYNGLAGNATNFYIKENYNPGTDSINFKKNRSTIHYYINSDVLTDAKYLGGIINTNWIGATVRTTNFNMRLNNGSDSYNPNYVPINSIQFAHTITRDSSAYIRYMLSDGTYITSTTRAAPLNLLASTAIPNQAKGMYALAINNAGNVTGYSGNTISFEYIGGNLTELQAQITTQAEDEYLTYFGKKRAITYTEVDVKKDGTGDYLTIKAALAGITDATYYKRYNVNFADTFTSKEALQMKNFVNIIGQDTITSRIICDLPADTTEAVIIATSAIDCDAITFEIKNCYVAVRNGRYAIHSDDGAPDLRYSMGFTQTIDSCKIVHLGNATADANYEHEVWETTQAMGVGLSWNYILNISNSELKSYGTNATESEALGIHGNSAATYKSVCTLTNLRLISVVNYSLKLNLIVNNKDTYNFSNVYMSDGLRLIGDGTYTDNTTFINNYLNGTLICF